MLTTFSIDKSKCATCASCMLDTPHKIYRPITPLNQPAAVSSNLINVLLELRLGQTVCSIHVLEEVAYRTQTNQVNQNVRNNRSRPL